MAYYSAGFAVQFTEVDVQLPIALPLDEQLQPKPAYTALHAVLTQAPSRR